MAKTLKELEQLKSDWLTNPSIELENEVGFEVYKEGLIRFKKHNSSTKNTVKELQNKSIELGCEGNIALTKYIFALEDRLKAIENLSTIPQNPKIK